MGACCSNDKVDPQNEELGMGEASPGKQSGKSLVSSDSMGMTKKRHCTDVIYLFLMILFTVSLIGLLCYCSLNGSIYRIINGYDYCGNVCGRYTEDLSEYACQGANYTGKPYLVVKEGGEENTVNLHRECRSQCNKDEGYVLVLNRCILRESSNVKVVNSIFSKSGLVDFLEEVAEDLESSWREIVYMCLIALALSIAVLLLLRFLAGLVVWIVLATVTVASLAGTIYLWVRWTELKTKEASYIDKRTVTLYLAFAIVATLVTIIILLIILVMRKRIQLVVQLFQEAGKAIGSMPLLLFQPFITFAALLVIVGLWIAFTIIIESSGFLKQLENNHNMVFKKDGAMKFTRWYNLLGLLWFSQFVIACQQMVVAGAVSKWFFTRNKDNLDYPILRSFKNLVRFHLGTVAFGSFFIALLQLLRFILVTIQNYTRESNNAVMKCIFKTCHCCLYCFEKVLAYLSRNAYIITAMHGFAFCKAGKQAFKLLATNALRVAAINSVGDFVLILAKVLVVIVTVIAGMEMLKPNEVIQHMWVPLTMAGLFAFLVGHAFISIYEMVIDTIFLCFCEDCESNDGLSKPYFMSRGLMEFVENSKKALQVLDEQNKNWSGATTRSVK